VGIYPLAVYPPEIGYGTTGGASLKEGALSYQWSERSGSRL